jgi:hypothetical protein
MTIIVGETGLVRYRVSITSGRDTNRRADRVDADLHPLGRHPGRQCVGEPGAAKRQFYPIGPGDIRFTVRFQRISSVFVCSSNSPKYETAIHRLLGRGKAISPPMTPPTIGATQNSQSDPSATPPPKMEVAVFKTQPMT